MMETAIALVQRIVGGKGYSVESLRMDESGLVAMIVDKNGKRWQLDLAERPELERGKPDRPEEAPLPASVREEEPEMPPAAPTTMANKPDFRATFDVIRRSADRLTNEAKALLADLKVSELRLGDEKLLIDAAAAAARGDPTLLRELAGTRKRLPEGTAAPPAH